MHTKTLCSNSRNAHQKKNQVLILGSEARKFARSPQISADREREAGGGGKGGRVKKVGRGRRRKEEKKRERSWKCSSFFDDLKYLHFHFLFLPMLFPSCPFHPFPYILSTSLTPTPEKLFSFFGDLLLPPAQVQLHAFSFLCRLPPSLSLSPSWSGTYVHAQHTHKHTAVLASLWHFPVMDTPNV